MPDDTPTNRDADTIRRILAGDVNAFEIIIDKYKNYIFSIVQRHVPPAWVEDTAQDAFIRIYTALPGFDHRSGFKRWMTTITIRACYDTLRKYYRSKEISMTDLPGDGENTVEDRSEKQAGAVFSGDRDLHETKALLSHALDQLTPENRILIALIYFEGYSVKEAARLMGWSTANVKIRAFRSRRQLNKILKPLIEA
jgi:RNA polymerase sigma-70 factor (ECF subfamily)